MNEANAAHPARPRRRWQVKVLFNGILLVVLIFVILQVMKNVASVSVTGIVTGTQLEVAAKQGGTLSRLETALNQPVRKSQTLARMSSPALDARIAAASAELEQLERSRLEARSDVQTALKQFTMNEKISEMEGAITKLKVNIASASATIQTTSETLTILREGVRRARKLLEEKAIARPQLEERQIKVQDALLTQTAQIAEWRRLLAERITLEESLKLYRQQAENLRQEQDLFLTEVDMNIRKVQGDLQTLRVEREGLILTAEADGVVSEVLRNAGELVSPGEPVLRIVTGDRKWVEAFVPPEQRLTIQPGDPVEILPNGTSKTRLSGKVRDILPVLKDIPFGGSAFLGISSQGYTVVIVDFEDGLQAQQLAQVGQRVKVVFLPKQKRRIG